MCDSAALLIGETIEQSISPHPEQPDFWEPQPMGGVVSFFPVQQKCALWAMFVWGGAFGVRAGFPPPQHLFGPCKSSHFPGPQLTNCCITAIVLTTS